MATIVLLSVLAGAASAAVRAEEPPAVPAQEVPAPAVPPAVPDAPDAATARVLYALGVREGQALAELGLDDAELAEVRKGWESAARGAVTRPVTAQETAALQRWLADRRATMARRREAAGKELAQAAAKNPGAVVLPSGAVFIPIAAGEGARPQPADRVRLHVRSMLADGTVAIDTFRRGAPMDQPLDQAIPCWKEGLARLGKGGRARLVCPAPSAYGDRGYGEHIPPGAAVIFEIELVEVVPRAKPGS
jgi:FKBP-type peptidyl-prolyl cis-trans isomerase